MKFSDFLSKLPYFIASPLTGVNSHLKLSPPEKREMLEKMDGSIEARKAAVLVLIYPKDNISTVALIMRNTYNGVHSNQIGFPGGKPEPEDSDLFATALRECYEEIGVKSDTVNLIRPLTPLYIPPSNFMVSPFFAFVDYFPHFKLDEREVVALVEMPLQLLLSNKSLASIEMDTSYSRSVQVPVFKIEQHNIWGATAMILSELKDLIGDMD